MGTRRNVPTFDSGLQELPDGHAFQISLCGHRGVGMCHKASSTGEFTVNSCPIMVGECWRWYYVKMGWVWSLDLPIPIPSDSYLLFLFASAYFLVSISYKAATNIQVA